MKNDLLNQTTDESEEFLHLLEDHMPSGDFKMKLKERVLNDSKNHNIFFNLFLMNKQKAAVLFSAMSVLLVTGVLGVYMFSQSRLQSVNFSEEEANSIFANIIKNNANSNRDAAPLSAESVDVRMASSLMIAGPIDREYKFSKGTTKLTRGNGISKCKLLDESFKNISYENVDYISSAEGKNYYKYKSFDSNGNLIDYSLTKDSKMISYKGGSYAVSTQAFMTLDLARSAETLEAPAPDNSFPAQETPAPTGDEIKQYFGPDVKIEGKLVENGKEYLIITYSSNTICEIGNDDKSRSATNIDNLKKTIIKIKVDSKNFNVVKEEQYLDSISDSNLLYTTESTLETSNPDFDSVASNFEFEFNVQIKDIGNQEVSSQQIAEMFSKYLSEKSIMPLVTTDYEIRSFYSSFVTYERQEDKYMLDRNFYPAGGRGDEMFNEAKEMYKITYSENEPLVTFDFAVGDNNANMTVYENNLSEEKILERYAYSENSRKEKTSRNIIINGVSKKATEFKVTNTSTSISGSESGSGDSAQPVETKTEDIIYVIIFEFEGKKYAVVHYSYMQGVDLNKVLKFKSLSIDELKPLLVKASENTGKPEPLMVR